MSRKLTRLVLAASVAAGFAVAPLTAVEASTSGIDVAGTQFGSGKPLDILKGDTVVWYIKDGKHTITPDAARTQPKWTKDGSGELEGPDDTFEVTFDKAGWYYYKCDVHEGMVGEINVKDPAATTTTTTPPVTTPPTSPPATQPPGPGVTTTTTSAPASSQGTKPGGTASPAPTTTTTAKDKKNKDDKKDDKVEETTTTTAPPPPPVDIPDSAIIPVLPGLQGTNTTSQDGVVLPDGAPEGDAIALLKAKKGGDRAMKLLIISGLGLGALGFGAAGYKYANRSSKYFPA